jgi:large subunit ribosomal protein L30
MESMIKITLAKSVIGAIPKQKATVQALGLKKTNSSVIQKDNPQVRGMIHKVRHLVKVEPAAPEN